MKTRRWQGGRVGARRPFCEVIYLQATALTSPAPSGSCSLVTVSPSCLLPPMLSGACVSQGRDEGSPHTHTHTQRGTWTSNRTPTYVPTVAYERAHAITDQTRTSTHTQTQTDEGNQKPCAQRPINLHTHTRPYTDHTCAQTHIVADECSQTHSATHSHTHTHIHARSVCVCAEACATTVANDCAHARSLTHVHARTQTHSSGLQRVGCSALSVREGCLWQAHTHAHRHKDRHTDTHTHTQGSREYSTPVCSLALREHQHWEVRGNLFHRGQEGTWNQRSYSGAR